MIEFPEDVSQAPSLEVAAERLGEILGLKQPAPLNATQRALDNPLYARLTDGAENACCPPVTTGRTENGKYCAAGRD